MTIEMNMNYDKIEDPSMDSDYDDEILETGWNPALELAPQEERVCIPDNQRAPMPPDLTTEVIEGFLRKMYSMQR